MLITADLSVCTTHVWALQARKELLTMSDSTQMAGKVVALWRYPIKSMMGEDLNATDVTTRGLLGDRAYALVDQATRKVASAKNPRKWPDLFDYRAAFVVPPSPGMPLPEVRITLPDGTVLTTSQSEINQFLSKVLQREVTLDAAERGQEEVVASTSPHSPRGECGRVLAGYGRTRLPRHGHRLCLAGGHLLRLCDRPSADHS